MTVALTPQAQLFDRLTAEGKDSESWAYLVLSACDGEAGLARYLDDGVEPQVRARFLAEGIGQVELTRSWTGEQEVDDGTTVATGAGKKLTDLAGLGWESAVQDFRPFMSHSELASRFEDGPTVLYRALLKGLGLEAFESIRECLAKAPHAARYLLLSEFDAAQVGQGTAEAFLDRLAALDPGPLTHLRAAYESDADIVRFYPY